MPQTQRENTRQVYGTCLILQRVYVSGNREFSDRAHILLEAIKRTNLAIMARHLSTLGVRDTIEGRIDQRFIRSTIASCERSSLIESVAGLQRLNEKCPPSTEPDAADLCPACRQPVGEGDVMGVRKCDKGHEWSKYLLTFISIPRHGSC